MDVIALARELGAALQQDERYLAFQKAQQANENDSELNENIARIDLLVDEILNTLTPLKEQAEVARKYLDYKDSLTSIEIALIARDIADINEEYKIVKNNVERLSNAAKLLVVTSPCFSNPEALHTSPAIRLIHLAISWLEVKTPLIAE